MENVYIAIASLVMVIIVSIIIDIRYKRRYKKMTATTARNIQINNTKLDFNRDVEFLLYLISSNCERYKVLMLEPKQVTSNGILNNTDLDLNTHSIVLGIIDIISPHYRSVMTRYFNDEGLITFTTEMVIFELTGDIVKLNSKKIIKMHGTTKPNNTDTNL